MHEQHILWGKINSIKGMPVVSCRPGLSSGGCCITDWDCPATVWKDLMASALLAVPTQPWLVNGCCELIHCSLPGTLLFSVI